MRSHWLNSAKEKTPADRVLKRGMGFCLDMALHEREALGVCFSEERDLLSQWRGYASDGAGFSISFDRNILEKVVMNSAIGARLHLCKIAYGYKDQEEIIAVVRQLADAFLEDARGYTENDGTGRINLSFGAAGEKHVQYQEAAARLFTVKNGAFSEEREWRIFAFGSLDQLPGVKFRTSGAAISPYLTLNLPDEAIVGVTIGPTNASPLHVVKVALARNGFEHVWVRSSAASYRSK